MIQLKVGIVLALLVAAQPLSAAWLEARTDHFIVYSEGNEASTIAFAAKLERFDQGMRKLRGLSDGELERANPLSVYVVSNISNVQKLCGGVVARPSAKTNCKTIAGFYTGRVSGALAFTPRSAGGDPDDALVILFHEYGHHIMLVNSAAAYPAWFTEGFAEFNSTAKPDKKGKVGFGLIARHRAYGLLLGKDIPIEKLLVGTTSDFKGGAELDVFYGRSWLLTHYLAFEPTRAGQLEKYLIAVNRGERGLDAARAAFGDLATLDRDLDRYMIKPMRYIELPVADVPNTAIKLRALSPGENALMPVRLQSDRGVDEEGAAALVIEARRLAAPFATDPGAQLALAEAELDAGNFAASEAAADRALVAAPDNYKALLFKGKALMALAQQNKTSEEGSWRRIRSFFMKANRLNNNGAEALWLFYRSFREQGLPPTPNAIAALERASALAPQDKQVRFALANEYLRSDRLAEARSVLVVMAYDPHAAPDNFPARIIKAIDSKDPSVLKALMSDKGAPRDGEEN